MSRIWPGVLLGVRADPASQECDRHGARAPGAAPPAASRSAGRPSRRRAICSCSAVIIRTRVLDRLPPREVLSAEGLLVVVGEHRVPLAEQPADPEAVAP